MHTENFRVVHVIARLNIGGTARYVHELLNGLTEKHIQTLLLVGNVQEGEEEDACLSELSHVRISNLGRKIQLFNDLNSYFKIRKEIKKFDPDIIHSHTFKAGLLCRLMLFKIPKVHTLHGHLLTDPEFLRYQKKIDVIIERYLGKLTQRIIVTGDRVRDDLVEHKVAEFKKFISIPGNFENFEMNSREDARQALGLTNQFTILWVGRLAKVKNPSLLIKIAFKLPDCEFLVAGDGILGENLRKSAPPNVRFLGFVTISQIIRSADVFLSTSLNEGVPISILEAQYSGLPIVAVNSGSISEIIEDGKTGILTSSDEKEIVEKIDFLQCNAKFRGELGENARKYSISRKTGNEITQKHIDTYRRIMSLD
jgi:glycosyltransferase involved in cell wall biosynthesis